jgi:hypothetical protein
VILEYLRDAEHYRERSKRFNEIGAGCRIGIQRRQCKGNLDENYINSVNSQDLYTYLNFTVILLKKMLLRKLYGHTA